MKFNKNLKGFICMALAVVMIFGSTFAYFTDRAGTNSKGTAGTVGIDLTSDINLLDADGKDILNPGDLRDSSFGVENTGNKSIDVRTTIVLTSSVPMTTGENGQAEYELYLRDDVHFVEGEGWKPNDGAQPVQVRSISEDGKTITYNVPDYILNGNEDFGDENREIEEGVDTDFHDNDFVLIFAGSQTDNDFQGSTVQIDVLVEAKQHRNTGAGWEIVAQEAYSNGAINQNAVLKADGTEGTTGTNLNVANGLPAKFTMRPKTTYSMTNTVTNNSSTSTDVQMTVDMSSDDSTVFENQLFGLSSTTEGYNYVDTLWNLSFGRRVDGQVKAYIDGVLTTVVPEYLIVELVATTEEYPFDDGSFSTDTYEYTDKVVAKYIIGNDYGWEINHLLKGTDNVILKPRILTPEGYEVWYNRGSRTLPYYVDTDGIYKAKYNLTISSDFAGVGQKYAALLYHPYDGTIDISEFIEGSGTTDGYKYEKIVNADGSVRYIFTTTIDSESGNTFAPALSITADNLANSSATYVDMNVEIQAKESSSEDGWEVISSESSTITLDKTGAEEPTEETYTVTISYNGNKYPVECTSGTYKEVIEKATSLVGNTKYHIVNNGTIIYSTDTNKAVTGDATVSLVVPGETTAVYTKTLYYNGNGYSVTCLSGTYKEVIEKATSLVGDTNYYLDENGTEIQNTETTRKVTGNGSIDIIVKSSSSNTLEAGLYDKNNEVVYTWEDLVNYDLVKMDGTTLLSVASDLEGTLILPEGITMVGDNAFANSYLTEIVLPSSVEAIGTEVFRDSYNLEKITVSEGTMTIKDGAFYGVPNLQELYLPSTLETLGEYAFVGLDYVNVYYAGSESDWYNLIGLNNVNPSIGNIMFDYVG